MSLSSGQASCVFCDSVYAEGEEHDCPDRAEVVRRARIADDFDLPSTGARTSPPAAAAPVSRRSLHGPVAESVDAPASRSGAALRRAGSTPARATSPAGSSSGRTAGLEPDDAGSIPAPASTSKPGRGGAGGAVLCAAPSAPVEDSGKDEKGGALNLPRGEVQPVYEVPPVVGIVEPSPDALAVLESDEATDLAVRRICEAIATCMDFDAVRDIADRAIAIRAYHRQRGAQLRIQNQVARVRFEAERRLGILLRDEVKVTRGRKGVGAGPLLRDLKITKKQSSIWQQIADVSDADFEQRCRDAFENDLELTTRRVLALPVPERKPKADAETQPARSSSEPKPANDADAESIARDLIDRLGPLVAQDVADEIHRQLAAHS